MACSRAWLVELPEIKEVTEEEVHGYIQPLVVPTFEVTVDFDFGPCCGWDFLRTSFATKEDAQAYIDEILDNRHPWIKHDPEFLQD